MKKLLIAAALTVGISASVLAQGTVIFESDQSTGTITTNDNNTSHFAHTGTYQVALLWAAGTTPVPVGNLTQLVVFTGNNNGFFHDGTPVTTGAQTPGAPAIFLVQGWTGNFANYAAAVAGNALVGQGVEFVNNTGNPTTTPAGTPVSTTGFDGNLILVPAPEPATIALGGLGAAALLLFRRRK